jgi:hypothetical protein
MDTAIEIGLGDGLVLDVEDVKINHQDLLTVPLKDLLKDLLVKE